MFTVEVFDDTTIVSVLGDLDIAVSARLGVILATARKAKAARIIVSLEKCRFCDASGLAELLTAHHFLHCEIIVVVAEGSKCRRVFEITGLNKVLHLVPTIHHAFAAKMRVAV